jgi:hypothetical protein
MNFQWRPANGDGNTITWEFQPGKKCRRGLSGTVPVLFPDSAAVHLALNGCGLSRTAPSIAYPVGASLAFEVDNLELELAKHPFRLISPIEKPSGGVRSVMIEHNGAPVN